MKHTIAGSTLALCLGFGALPASAQQPPAVRVDVAEANFRTGCSLDADVIADLERGEVLDLLGTEGSWYRVRHVESGIEGCMHRSVLELMSPADVDSVTEEPLTEEPVTENSAVESIAQEPPPSASPAASRGQVHWDLGPRIVGFRETGDSYEFVYGSDFVFQYGLRLEVQANWLLLALEGTTGEADGELVLPVDPPIGQGQEPTLTLTPIHLTGGWAFRSDRALRGYVGAGVTHLSWEEELGDRSNSGEEVGYHIAAGLRWSFAERRFALAADLMSIVVPDAIGKGGTSQLVGETDIEGISLGLGILFRLR